MNFEKYYEPCPTTGCWLWLGAVNSSGYANKYFKGRMETAHRISWMLHHGAIPSGLSVLHHCDVRCCVNPGHLFLGTQKQNLQDMFAKGRQHKMSNLTEGDVRIIRHRHFVGSTLQHIGDDFGLTKQAIHAIVTRKYWRHVT